MVAEVRAARTESSVWGSIEKLSLPAVLGLLRSCLGPQTANWAILAGVFDITITFHHLLSPLRFYLWSDYTAHNPSILKCSLVYIVLTFKFDNQDIYCRLNDMVHPVGLEPTLRPLVPKTRVALAYTIFSDERVATWPVSRGDHICWLFYIPHSQLLRQYYKKGSESFL